MKIKLMIAGLFVLAFAFTSQAQTNKTSRVLKKEFMHQMQLKQGVTSGHLTKKRIHLLQKKQNNSYIGTTSTKKNALVQPKKIVTKKALRQKADAKVYRKEQNKRIRQ